MRVSQKFLLLYHYFQWEFISYEMGHNTVVEFLQNNLSLHTSFNIGLLNENRVGVARECMTREGEERPKGTEKGGCYSLCASIIPISL